jgi:hypothetical protein
MRPQDTYGDGRDWKFETSEHGGDEPDNMPQVITATDPARRWAVYVPLSRGGKIVIPHPIGGDRPVVAFNLWPDQNVTAGADFGRILSFHGNTIFVRSGQVAQLCTGDATNCNSNVMSFGNHKN